MHNIYKCQISQADAKVQNNLGVRASSGTILEVIHQLVKMGRPVVASTVSEPPSCWTGCNWTKDSTNGPKGDSLGHCSAASRFLRRSRS